MRNVFRLFQYGVFGQQCDIRSDFAHLGVHVIEQAGEVARDAIDQNAFYPFLDDLTNQAKTNQKNQRQSLIQ